MSSNERGAYDRPLTGVQREEAILRCVSDMVSNFLYYDRREDDELPVGSIVEALDLGETTTDRIVEEFRAELARMLAKGEGGA